MVKDRDFSRDVELPPGLTIAAIKKSVEYIEREAGNLVELYFEQANVFSGVVGILGTRALDTFSVYEKSRHADLAQQRFPDLCRRGAGADPSPNECLESKASKRPWAMQSHYDHEGWYIVWRYLVDSTCSIEPRKAVIVWRIDVVYLKKEDWTYEGSTAGASGGGRTHTFGVKNPADRLRGKAVYCRSDIKLIRGKPTPANGD